jgi:hypothetical protein
MKVNGDQLAVESPTKIISLLDLDIEEIAIIISFCSSQHLNSRKFRCITATQILIIVLSNCSYRNDHVVFLI